MRNRQNLLRNKSLTFWGHLTVCRLGRLFLCLIIIPVEYVSVTNAGDAEADDRKESHFYLNDREANKSVLYLRNNKYTKSGFAKEGVS